MSWSRIIQINDTTAIAARQRLFEKKLIAIPAA
jgi:hypothetical protein